MTVHIQVVPLEQYELLERELQAWRDRFPTLCYCQNSGSLYFEHEWGRDDMGRCTKCGERERP